MPTWNNPLGTEAIDEAVGLLALAPDDRVLDVGCGEGDVLALVLDRYRCRGTGIDSKADALSAARERLAAHEGRVELVQRPFAEVELPAGAFAAVLCVGSTHAFAGPGEGYLATLRRSAELLRDGGLLLVGEGYWRRPPAPEYLAATGIGAGEFTTHAENVERAIAVGYVPLLVRAASEQDWDRFEGRFWLAAEEDLRRAPDDPAVRARADHWRNWRAAYLRWGRETLGFGLYVLRKGA